MKLLKNFFSTINIGRFFKLTFLLIIFVPGISSIVITYFDKAFKYQYLSIVFYLISIVPIFLFFIFSLIKKYLNNKFYTQSKNQFLIIIILAIFTRFLLLSNYPYAALGDEVRDGGINGVQIFNHEILNIFGYGRYDAHGLIIPTITSTFYPIFGNSTLMYRIPAAIIGILDILFVYILIFTLISPKAGFFSALTLISLPLHLFYSRTQIVVIFSSFITTLFIASIYYYFKHKNIWRYVFLGLLIGLSFNFHASIKTVGITTLLLILFFEIKKISIQSIKNIFLLFLSILVGFGPRLIYTPFNIFFHSSRLESFNQLLYNLPQRYFNSILVWFFLPTKSFFNNNLSLLPISLFLIIIFGLFCYFKKNKSINWFNYILFLSLSIPFTNSAITDGINYDHRLSPLFPISAILVGCCFWFICQNYTDKKIKLLEILLVLFLSLQTITFYSARLADVNWNNFIEKKDFLSMHIIKFIQSNKPSSSKLCLTVPKQYLSYFDLTHIQEQYNFFLPQYSITFYGNNRLSDYQVIIDTDCLKHNNYKQYTYSCTSKYDFSCPKDYQGKFLIYY